MHAHMHMHVAARQLLQLPPVKSMGVEGNGHRHGLPVPPESVGRGGTWTPSGQSGTRGSPPAADHTNWVGGGEDSPPQLVPRADPEAAFHLSWL